MEDFYLYRRMDALLLDAALKFSRYKEEDYCLIGLKKGGLDSNQQSAIGYEQEKLEYTVSASLFPNWTK